MSDAVWIKLIENGPAIVGAFAGLLTVLFSGAGAALGWLNRRNLADNTAKTEAVHEDVKVAAEKADVAAEAAKVAASAAVEARSGEQRAIDVNVVNDRPIPVTEKG